MDKAEASYFRAATLRLMMDDLALRVLAALARALASVRRRAREMRRTLAIAIALVPTSG
jgi:hypothetical protein